MKVYVAWEHSSFKNVDLVAIQSFDPQAQIFKLQYEFNIQYEASENLIKNLSDPCLNIFTLTSQASLR